MMPSDYPHLLTDLRAQRPLVHNITNYVVMNFTANALLAIGAAPVMAHAVEEVEAMVGLASALVINIGTLSEPWIAAMKLAIAAAGDRGVPYVLDPVGAGATPLRTDTAKTLISLHPPAVIRGNASEIGALANAAVTTRGVDSTLAASDALAAARTLSQQFHTTVVISGEVDYIIQGDQQAEIHNGDRRMAQVTGMGCTATALLGAFVAVAPPFAAAVATMATMGVAGELAAQQAQGPGTFVPHFLDALAALSADTLKTHTRLVET